MCELCGRRCGSGRQQMDNALTETGRKTLLPRDILQGKKQTHLTEITAAGFECLTNFIKQKHFTFVSTLSNSLFTVLLFLFRQ